jgi:hypothetical protein
VTIVVSVAAGSVVGLGLGADVSVGVGLRAYPREHA